MTQPSLLEELSDLRIPDEIASALIEILEGGQTADSQESQTLDFKEDPATAHPGKGNPDARLIETILKTSICMANGNDQDSFIVLGVKDKISGPQALTGTECKADWLRERIYSKTQPGLDVTIEELPLQGKRLLLIRIPQPLRVYSLTNGNSCWYRVGTSCQVMTEEKRRQLDWERRNPDFTAKPANITEADLDLGALEIARQLLAKKRTASGSSEVPDTHHGLIRELGLTGTKGTLLLAGEILLACPSTHQVAVRYLYRPFPGGEPRIQDLACPAVALFGLLQSLIESHSPQEIARVDLGSGQEVSIPAFPRQAVDEVVSNALLHRDWVAAGPIVIEHTPRTLTVTSPGGLPPSVSTSHLLTTRSVPRNPALMNAVRRLGLAEESSRGFDRMWVSMLGSGRRAPVVEASEFEVRVTLDAGEPDISFLQGLAALTSETKTANVHQSVNALIILRYLVDHPGILGKTIAEKLQTNSIETHETIDWLRNIGILTKTSSRIDEWTLTPTCRELFRITHERATMSEATTWIQERLDKGISLTARDIVNHLKIDTPDATKLLRKLRAEGVAMIDPEGPQRGSNTRWIRRPHT